jgi:hypothetical protein
MDKKQIAVLRAALEPLLPIARALIALNESLGDEPSRDKIEAETTNPVALPDREITETERKLEAHRRDVEEMRRRIELASSAAAPKV